MSKTRLEPMGDYLLVVDMPRTTILDEIELPSNIRQQEMTFGVVVAIGPNCLVLKEQDRICFGPYAGKGVVLEGVEFRLLRAGQVEGKIVSTN